MMLSLINILYRISNMRLQEDLEAKREIDITSQQQQKPPTEKTEVPILYLILLSLLALVIGIITGKFL